MSLDDEVKGLIKLLAPLVAEAGDDGPDPPPVRGCWYSAAARLDAASRRFAEAAAGSAPRSVERDLAEDLRREAEGLAARARVLARRAAPGDALEDHPARRRPTDALDPEKAKDRAEQFEEDLAEERGAEAIRELETRRDEAAAARAARRKKPPGRVAAGQLSIETARNWLSATPPTDPTTIGFIDQLDFLAELALSVRRRFARAAHEVAVTHHG